MTTLPRSDDVQRRQRFRLGAYRNRDAAFPGPPPLRVGDDKIRLLREVPGAEARGASINHVGPPSTRKPTPVFREPNLRPLPGTGLLSLHVHGDETAPVAAVDGVPVSVGSGQVDLILRTGFHTVEVQSDYVSGPVVVRIEEGRTRRLRYYRNHLAGMHALGDLPEEHEPLATNAGCLLWFVSASLLCGLPYGVAGYFSQDLRASAIVTAVIAVALIAVCTPLSRKAKRAHAIRVAEQAAPAPDKPEPYPWGGPPQGAVLLGPNPSALPPLPPGTGAIDLDLACGRHLWMGRRKAERGSFLGRAWTAPPQVLIDGVPQPAGWSRWRYPVAQGRHRVTVIADGHPSNLEQEVRQVGEPRSREDYDVEVLAGRSVQLRAEAQVYAVWRPSKGDVEAWQPRLQITAT